MILKVKWIYFCITQESGYLWKGRAGHLALAFLSCSLHVTVISVATKEWPVGMF